MYKEHFGSSLTYGTCIYIIRYFSSRRSDLKSDFDVNEWDEMIDKWEDINSNKQG
jgi:hypothetical protein